MSDLAIIILAAGRGTRMKSQLPKVLHPIAGLPLLGHALVAARELSPQKIILITGDHAPEVGDYAKEVSPGIETAVQSPPQGTGHAVMQALPALHGFKGTVIALFADTPLIRSETIAGLQKKIEAGASAAALGFRPDDPSAYGRLVLDSEGALQAIVEAKDATQEELEITLCNSGVMAFDADYLARALPNVGNDNAKGEYYLTDMIALARQDNLSCAMIEGDEDEVLGVNSRIELAAAEKVFQQRRRRGAMADGASLIDPDSVFFSYDTKIGRDVEIGPNVVFGPGVTVEDGVVINAFTHLEGAHIETGAVIGPYARLRPGASIGARARVGNFVELKKARLGDGAKANHLAYLGDAEIGPGANIGAGTITCNYDGYAKHRTQIGPNAFVGSNSSLVAPVKIGEGAYVGSGSVITKDVEMGALAVARGRQIEIKAWAARFHKANRKDGSSDDR